MRPPIRTLMTLRKPSSISRSFRLSKSFFIWTAGRSRVIEREVIVRPELADWAASSVNSRAMLLVSIPGENLINDLPVSNMDDIFEIDSILS